MLAIVIAIYHFVTDITESVSELYDYLYCYTTFEHLSLSCNCHCSEEFDRLTLYLIYSFFKMFMELSGDHPEHTTLTYTQLEYHVCRSMKYGTRTHLKSFQENEFIH